MRCAALWLVLALVTAGMPRWQIHAHAADGAETTLSDLMVEPHTPIQSDWDHPGSLVPHVHAVSQACATLPTIAPLSVATLATANWLPAFYPPTAAYLAGPPPHRPPIG